MAGFTNPQVTVIVPYKMFLAELMHVCKSQTCVAAKGKHVPNLLQPFYLKILFHQPVQFFLG